MDRIEERLHQYHRAVRRLQEVLHFARHHRGADIYPYLPHFIFHTYHEEIAEEIFDQLPGYVKLMERTVEQIEKSFRGERCGGFCLRED